MSSIAEEDTADELIAEEDTADELTAEEDTADELIAEEDSRRTEAMKSTSQPKRAGCN